MARELTTDVMADQQIAAAMTPHIPLPFKDVLVQAQAMLDLLAKSLFFRRYVAEKIAEHGEGRNFIRVASATRQTYNECLVLTDDYQLKFWISDRDKTCLFSWDGCAHDEWLLARATSRLHEMSTPMGAMRYLMTRFGAPSFTVADIEAEATRNGSVRLIMISYEPNRPELAEPTQVLWEALKRLQFSPEVLHIGFADLLPPTEQFRDAQSLFVLELRPGQVEATQALFAAMPTWMTQRLIIHIELERHMYKSIGYTAPLIRHLTTAEFVDMKPKGLLAQLDDLFTY